MALTSVTGMTPTTGSDPLDDIVYETKEDHATLDREDFMKLFVTQLQYQDPMNPMDSEAMASQVAQFNMVDLLYKSNHALEEMTKAENLATSMSAISLLGNKVQYEGNELLVTENGPEPFYIKGSDEMDASQVSVSIIDQNGNVVKKIDIGPIAAGETRKLDWDGTNEDGDTVEPGTYKAYVTAEDIEGNDMQLGSIATGIVKSIDQNSGEGLPQIIIDNGPTLNLEDILKVES